MQEKLDGMQVNNETEESSTPFSPYNNTLTLPLEDFVGNLEVQDVLNNGATLQVG